MPHAAGIGAIYGIVAEDSVPKVGSPIRLYDRSTGRMVKATVSAADGGYVFAGLSPYTDDYMVLATDEDGTPKKNALVHDRVTPVPASQGSEFYGNWIVKTRKFDPIRFATTNLPTGYGAAAIPTAWGWNGFGSAQGSVFTSGDQTYQLPGSPALTGTKWNSGAIGEIWGTGDHPLWLNPSRGYGTHPDNSGRKLTLFYITNFSADWGFVEDAISTSSGTYFNMMFRLKWNGTNTITFEWRTTVTANETTSPLTTYLPGGSGWTTQAYNLTSFASQLNGGVMTGVHSVAVAYFAGGTSSLYVDGILIGTFNTAQRGGISSSDWNTSAVGEHNSWYRTYFTNGSYGTLDGTETLYATGVFPLQMSTADVLEVHQSFFTAQTPAITGYAKECTLQGAQTLIITDTGEPTDNLYPVLTPALDRTGKTTTFPRSVGGAFTVSGSPTTGLVSPITGRSCVDFTNGGYYNEWGGGISQHSRYTQYEFMVYRPSSPAVTGDEYIMRKTRIESQAYTTVFRHIRITSARRFVFFFYAALSDSISPTYVLPYDTWVKVFFHWRRDLATWQLWINDTWVETGTTNGSSTADAFVGNAYGDYIFSNELGAAFSGSQGAPSRANAFRGRIASLAVWHMSYDPLTNVIAQDFMAKRAAALLVP